MNHNFSMQETKFIKTAAEQRKEDMSNILMNRALSCRVKIDLIDCQNICGLICMAGLIAIFCAMVALYHQAAMSQFS